MFIRILAGALVVTCGLIGQPTFVIDDGRLNLQNPAATPVIQSAHFNSAAPSNLTLSLANAPWLSFAVLPKSNDSCDATLQFTPGSSSIARNVLTSDWTKVSTGYSLTVCFQVTSSSDKRNPRYLPDGWYSGYLRVILPGAAPVFYPIPLSVTPSGYLTLLDARGNSIDFCDADNTGAPCNRLVIDASSGVPLSIIAKVNIQNTDNLGGSTVKATFSATDDSTGAAPAWLSITNATGSSAQSPVSVDSNVGYTFKLGFNSAGAPAGATLLKAHFSVQSMDGLQDRSSVLFTVTNVPVAPNASFQLSSPYLTFGPADPLSQQFTIGSTGQPISFNISSNKGWLGAVPASGTTPATVNVTIDPSRIPAASDTGTLFISDATGRAPQTAVNVFATQAPTCTYGLSRTSDSVGPAAGSGSVSVTAGSGCAWSATSDAGWLRLTGGQSGAGPGTVTYSYDANSGALRTCHILVNGQQFTLTQGALSLPQIQFTIDSDQIRWGSSAKLSWRVTGAASVSIDQGIGAVGSSGSQTVRPGCNTKYTLTAQNSGGSQTATATVTISGQPPGNLGILTASPNPILSSAGAGGPVTLSWTAPQSVQNVEIHINAPNGELLGGGPNSGSMPAGSPVTDGTTFYLQDVTGGNAPAIANTLDTVTIWVAPPDAVFFKASPVYAAAGKDSGTALLTWNAPAAANVQLWVESSNGTQMTGDLPSTGSALTGDWAKEGTLFYLQNSVNGNGAGDANTIARLQTSFTPPPSAPGPGSNLVIFYADPNPITTDPSNQSKKGKLYWHAPGYSQLAIFVLAPDGPQMTGILTGDGSVDVPDWATDGTVFYLQNAAGGSPAGAANTLASVTLAINH